MWFAKWKLGHWLLVSLLIHACAVCPLAYTGLHKAKPVKRDKKLQIELFGMVSSKQLAVRKRGADIPPLPPPPASIKPLPVKPEPEKPKPVKKPPVKKMVVKKPPPPKEEKKIPPSPVKVEKEEEAEEKSPAPMQAQAPVAPPPLAPAPGLADEVDQVQQTIASEAQVQDFIQAYMAQLSRRLQSNLVYPQEVRKKGVEGVVRIAFVVTESGGIKGGSLQVRRSSGFSILDKNAIQSALDSLPFEPPPKEILICLDVAFTVNMHQTREV